MGSLPDVLLQRSPEGHRHLPLRRERQDLASDNCRHRGNVGDAGDRVDGTQDARADAGGLSCIPSSARNPAFCQACQTRVAPLLPVPGEYRPTCFPKGRFWTSTPLLVTCGVVPNVVQLITWALQWQLLRSGSKRTRTVAGRPPDAVSEREK